MSSPARDDRHALRRHCEARFLAGGIHTLRGQVCDVSPEGLCLALDAPIGVSMLTVGPPEIGRQLFIEFQLPTGRVEAVAEVRWLTRHADGRVTTGLRFLRIPLPSQNAIRTLMSSNPRNPPRLEGRWGFA